MFVLRYLTPGTSGSHIGLRGDDGAVTKLPVDHLSDLLRMPLADMREFLSRSRGGAAETEAVSPIAPVDGLTEVWAAGVTYERSRDARVEESQVRDVYDRVYDAARPELFFKSVAWRVVADGDAVGIRTDSELNVPEPELALVVNSAGEIAGLTICNDVSSRSIEGENPLYLPQAKVYAGSCALGPAIRPIWEVENPGNLGIEVRVRRGHEVVWEAATSTRTMHRKLSELIDYLYRAQSFPSGVILATGTGLAPNLDFSLEEADVVEVAIEHIGVLSNSVVHSDRILMATSL